MGNAHEKGWCTFPDPKNWQHSFFCMFAAWSLEFPILIYNPPGVYVLAVWSRFLTSCCSYFAKESKTHVRVLGFRSDKCLPDRVLLRSRKCLISVSMLLTCLWLTVLWFEYVKALFFSCNLTTFIFKPKIYLIDELFLILYQNWVEFIVPKLLKIIIFMENDH